MSIITQISEIVQDAFEDATGQSLSINTLDSTAIVSMGKEIQAGNKYEPFYGSLMNRIVETYFYTRVYEASTRNILRDEHEYGAFVQRTYTTAPDAVDNPEYNFDDVSGDFEQLSPYAVQTTCTVDTKIYGGKGTWAREFITPMSQLKTAFRGLAEMEGFIDSQLIVVENKFKVEEEALVALAANTAMAYAINKGLARNLLAEYNTAHSGATITVAQAFDTPDFLRYACREISTVKDYMKKYNVIYNGENYLNYTPEDSLVLEVNTQFEKACSFNLYSDTFHKELVELPNFESVPYWQTSGSSFDFADTSKISIEHDDFATVENVDGEVTQGGIIAFMHDIENVAAYFGERRKWDIYNPRSDVMVHGETANKGFAVDGHYNSYVFYIADESNNDSNDGQE